MNLLPPLVLVLPDSEHNTSAAVGKISESLTQPHKNQPNRPPDAPSRAAKRSGRRQAFSAHAPVSRPVSPSARHPATSALVPRQHDR
jgi:hypothetical protein